MSFSPTIFNFWRTSLNMWINKQWLTYNGISYNCPQLGAQWKNLINLPQNWMIIINANGNLKGNANTYTTLPSMKFDISVQKIMKNCWIKARIENMFYSKEKGYSRYTNIYTSHYVNYYSPSFYMIFSYSFNPAKSKYKGQTAGQSEIDRL